MSLLDSNSDLDEVGPNHDPLPNPRPPRRPTVLVLVTALVGAVMVVVVGAILALALSSNSADSEETGLVAGKATTSPTLSDTTASTESGTAADLTDSTVDGADPSPSTVAPTDGTTVPPTTATTVNTTGATQTTVGQQRPSLPEDCSARGLGPWPDQPGLPAPVAEKRAAILDAATACDLDRLIALTAPDFLASLGGGDTAAIWADLEANGEEPMRFLVELLGLPHRRIQGADATIYYTWPAAFGLDPGEPLSDQDRADLSRLYSDEEIEQFEELGYVGYRIVIYDGGAWVNFVGGD